MAARTSPAIAAFSYAQAARGISPATSGISNAAEPNKNGQPKIDRRPSTEPSGLDISATSKDSGNHDEPSRSLPTQNAPQDSSQVSGRTSKTGPWDSVVNDIERPAAHGLVTEHGESSQSKSAAGGSTSATPKDLESSAVLNGTSDSGWDKHSQTSGGADKSQQAKDDAKSKENDDDWEKVSVPSVGAEKELKAAPLPTVNIWQQRKEAQDAKTKAFAPPKPAANPPVKSKDGQQGNGIPKPVTKPRGLGITDESESKERKKSSDAGKPTQEVRKLSRSNRAPQEKETSEMKAPPPVADAIMWPTPENSMIEEKKTSSTEKSEKFEDSESKTPLHKPHTKEKWVKVDHVPSVKWEFYTPPTTSRRGGRAGRGSRENGGRGGHASSGSTHTERNEKTGAMGPPALPRPQRLDERGRIEPTSASVRSSSVPTQESKDSAPTAEANDTVETPIDQKPAPATGVKADATPSQDSSTANATETTLPARPRGDSKAGFRYNNGTGYKGNNFDPARASNYHGESHSHPKNQGVERRSIPPDFYTPAEIFGKERSEREHGNRRSDFARDSNPNWRERDIHSERPDRREQRSERGRGTYRGRGNHNNYNSHNSQNSPWSTPLPQHPFPTKSQGFNERHRQSSAPFMGNVQQASRSNIRSQSIPSNGIAGISAQPMSPTGQEFQGMFYPMSQSMTAQVPYSMDVNLMTTMKLVQAQIEYYFSIENLCKDLFLRRHMDSQGYVLFSFIAGFKRLQQLTDDANVIRETCSQIPSIEYVRGDDGLERLRRREGWGQWIMPPEDRDSTAQNAGPISVRYAGPNYHDRYPQMFGQGYAMSPTQEMSSQLWTNGGMPPQFYAQPFAYGRNEAEYQQTNPSMFAYGGNYDHTAGPEANDDNRGFYTTQPEQKANGPLSPSLTAPLNQHGSTPDMQMDSKDSVLNGHAPSINEQVESSTAQTDNKSRANVHQGTSSQDESLFASDSGPSASLHGGASNSSG